MPAGGLTLAAPPDWKCVLTSGRSLPRAVRRVPGPPPPPRTVLATALGLGGAPVGPFEIGGYPPPIAEGWQYIFGSGRGRHVGACATGAAVQAASAQRSAGMGGPTRITQWPWTEGQELCFNERCYAATAVGRADTAQLLSTVRHRCPQQKEVKMKAAACSHGSWPDDSQTRAVAALLPGGVHVCKQYARRHEGATLPVTLPVCSWQTSTYDTFRARTIARIATHSAK